MSPTTTPLHEIAATIALTRRGRRPAGLIAEEIEEAGSAVAVLKADAGDDELALFTEAEEPSPDDDFEAVVEEVRGWLADGIEVHTVLDEGYPANLRTIHDRPPLIFVAGQLEPRDESAIAVVGTRKPSAEGLSAARQIAADIASAGRTVVSGLAAGIDTAVHEAAIAHGRTIAVIGTGLRRAYPASNAELQRRLAEESAVISQFWPDSPPTRRTFPMRNAVMSGLALATVVVEAAGKSGARMQAGLALRHGRPVFLLRTLLEHPWARDYADRPGVFVIEAAEDVIARVERLTSFDSLSFS